MPFVNIKTDYGALGNGQDVTATFTILVGTPNRLTATSSPFVSGDVGKVIGVQGAGVSGGILQTTIASFVDANNVNLTAAASTFFTATSKRVVWGADDSAAFASFNTANAGLSGVTLTVPAGLYLIGSSFHYGFGNGVSQFIVSGTGAKITNFAIAGNWFLGTSGPNNGIHNVASPGQWQANTKTAFAGNNYVDLVDPTQTSVFTIGNWALMSGYDMQGTWTPGGFGYGLPPNLFFFQYVLVSAIDSAPASPTYGRVTFSAPLKNTYASTWPLWDKGSVNGPYEGGPATLYWLSPNWNTDAEFDGLTYEAVNSSGTGDQIGASGRKITINGGVSLGNGVFPTQVQTFVGIGHDWSQIVDPQGLEIDKIIETCTFQNCTFYDVKHQSSSPLNMTMDSCTVHTMNGTPRKTTITNSTINTLGIGALAYGRADGLTATGCTISNIEQRSVFQSTEASWSLIGNVITIPNTSFPDTANPTRWAAPGTYFSYNVGGRIAKVLDVSQDPTNTYVSVTRVSPSNFVAGTTHLVVHGCPSLTLSGCTGCDDVVSFSQAPAGAPIYSYQTRTYTILPNLSSNALFLLWGKIKSITFDVQKAYTGTQLSLLFHLSFFENWPVYDATDTPFNYGPIVDLKVQATRTITPGGATVGAQPNDVGLSIPAGTWFKGTSNNGPSFSADISGESSAVYPRIVVTMQTDQGLITGAVAPLRMRLHA